MTDSNKNNEFLEKSGIYKTDSEGSDKTAVARDNSKSVGDSTDNEKETGGSFGGIAEILRALPSHTIHPPPERIGIIDEVCQRVYRDLAPSEDQISERRRFLGYLQQIVCLKFPDALLYLYGSSLNGFEFSSSDLDVCLMLLRRNLCPRMVIQELWLLFRSLHPDFFDVHCVLNCRVPILKLKYGRPGRSCDVDLSINNVLAGRNSVMLSVYSSFDSRLKHLGYTLKFFSKMCGIGDASSGGLSSYALIILLIYFLQQKSVLPVLQEVSPLDKERLKDPSLCEDKVDGWNAWFYRESREDLLSLFPEVSNNHESAGSLLLGFFDFYLQEFRYEDNVICIRRRKVLSRKERKWTRSFLAIEDPFELNHNLGASAKKETLLYTFKAWNKAREVLVTSENQVPLRYYSFADFFFDPNHYVRCSHCKELGHAHGLCKKTLGPGCAVKNSHERERSVEDQDFIAPDLGVDSVIGGDNLDGREQDVVDQLSSSFHSKFNFESNPSSTKNDSVPPKIRNGFSLGSSSKEFPPLLKKSEET